MEKKKRIMDCKNCIHCVQSKKEELYVICSNKQLLKKLGLFDEYERIGEPCYCIYYKTKKQHLKEEIKKLKKGRN